MSKMKGKSLQNTMPTLESEPDADDGMMDDPSAEADIQDLHRAHAVMKDPERLKKVHKMAGRKHKALMGLIEPAMQEKAPIRTLADLKKKANSKM